MRKKNGKTTTKKSGRRPHRGKATSSSIGTTIDSFIDTRIEHLVPFTQAQGGGKRGTSTFDHLFILRAIIDISISQSRQSFITFYDVQKAFDNVDNEDMLTTMWEKGLRGKSWRILANLNKDLSATIKTKVGETREIQMEIGGKQGSRLTGRMFSKLIDLLAEDFIKSGEGFTLTKDLIIPILLWVDDVVTLIEGKENQETSLVN